MRIKTDQISMLCSMLTSCSLCLVAANYRQARSFSHIRCYTSSMRRFSLSLWLSISCRSRDWRYCCSIISCSFSAIKYSTLCSCLSISYPCESALASRSFIAAMCCSRLQKFSVSMASFCCSAFSEAYESCSWNSRVAMALLFSPSMSSKMWISPSMSLFCRYSSSSSISSFLLANSSLVSCSVSAELLSLQRSSSISRFSKVLRSSATLHSTQLFCYSVSLLAASLALASRCKSSIRTSQSLLSLLSSSSFLILSISSWQFFSFWYWLIVSSSQLAFCNSLLSCKCFSWRSFSTSLANCLFWISSWRDCSLRAQNSRIMASQPLPRTDSRPLQLPENSFDCLVGVQSLRYILTAIIIKFKGSHSETRCAINRGSLCWKIRVKPIMIGSKCARCACSCAKRLPFCDWAQR